MIEPRNMIERDADAVNIAEGSIDENAKASSRRVAGVEGTRSARDEGYHETWETLLTPGHRAGIGDDRKDKNQDSQQRVRVPA